MEDVLVGKIVDVVIILFGALSKHNINGGELYADWAQAETSGIPVDVEKYKAKAAASRAALAKKLGQEI